jgi:uncharacterized membrane protein
MPSTTRFELHLQRYFITGLITLLPLWLTWVVFRFVLGLLSGLTAPGIHALAETLAAHFPMAFGWMESGFVQNAIAVFCTLVLIYVVGLAANRVFGQRALAWFEQLIDHIPLVQSIYGGAKKLLAMVGNKADRGERVVLIEFPHPGVKAIGFVTRVFTDAESGAEVAAVFVPTTPNPTGGYLEVVPTDRLTPLDWSMDQAMAFILSGGAVGPERIAFGNFPARRDAL